MTPAVCLTEEDTMAAAAGEALVPDAQAHLAGCGDCRRQVERLREDMSTLRIALSGSNLMSESAGASDGGPTGGGAEPACLGKYLIAGRLEQSENETVYRGTHTELHAHVLIRLAQRRPVPDADVRQRLLDEGRKLAVLEHDNLVTVRDMNFYESRPFLVSDLIRGPTLEQRLAGRPLPARTAAEWAAGLAGAVAAAHVRGLFHNEIRPAAIRLDDAGRPRLTGWGSPLLTGRTTPMLFAPRGGPDCRPPEEALGRPDAGGRRNDVFRLGAVLFQMLTGRPAATALPGELAGDPTPAWQADRATLRAAGVPPRLEAICLRALADDPARRYADAGGLESELASHLGGSTAAVRLTVAAVSLLALAGAAWWFFTQR